MSKLDDVLKEIVTARVQLRIVRYWKKHDRLPAIEKIIAEQTAAVYDPIMDHIDAMLVSLKISQREEESEDDE